MTVQPVAVSIMAGVLGGMLGAGVMSVAHGLLTREAPPDASSAAQGEDATVKGMTVDLVRRAAVRIAG